MNKKIYIVVVLGVIITTLSQTVSFISGDHQFYESVQDKCTKCHGDIQIQLSSSANHSSYSCNYCHTKSATNHTNTNPECQYCHNATQKLSDQVDAHTDFAPLPNSQGCVACHTTYNTIVNYSRADYIDYTITNTKGSWVVSNVTTIGTLDLSYNAQRQGGSHEIENVSCKDCHKDIFDAAAVGGHAVVLNKNGTQVPAHNSTNSTQEAWCRTCHNRNDTNFTTQPHSVRRITCEECHQAYNLTPHPGNLFVNMNTVPHLYQSLVCISCKSIGWPAPGGAIRFTVRQEPYFNVTYEIIDPLSIVNSSPASDPTTMKGVDQTFAITLNRAADIYWYNNGSEIFRALSVISSSYTSSSSIVGVYNITAVADDGYTSISRTWNWTVINQTGGGGGGGGGSPPVTGGATGSGNSSNISGYVFDNKIVALPDVLVQNGSYQNTTNASGYYSITNLPNGNYTFSYSKAGFDTGYSIFSLNGASVENVNVVIYDTTPPAQVSNPNTTAGSFYINNTWINPIDGDFNYTWFNYSNGTTLQSVNKSTDYLNLTWSPHYTQNISAQTVDIYDNVNQTPVWFNATVPNNAPIQLYIGNKTIDEGQWLNFTVSATDADNDTITYGTNATKGSLNTTTGNFSWTPTYGDAGVYNWYFNSSDNYSGISTENIAVTVNNVPLSITGSSPVSDPATAKGMPQTFEINLNRTADTIWYNNGYEVFRVLNATSSSYTNSSADTGMYNITAAASDSFDSVSRSWNWNVTAGSGGGWDRGSGSGGSSTNSISGYVFDNYGSILPGVLVQDGSYQNITDSSGYYSITNLSNGTCNFSYSMAGFDTAYFEFTFNGVVVTNANRTLYDNMSSASISDPAMTTGNFYVNNTWVNPIDADFNHTWFRYSNDTTLQNVSKPVNYLNLTWSPHYTQNISAQTVDISGNVNQTRIWFNTTIPNNAPFQYSIGDKAVNENENIQFNVAATDADNDTITYGTNATKGSLNTTTGNFSWTPTYEDAGVYTWYFNSSDGYGGVAVENLAITVNDIPLSVNSSSPLSDPVTELGIAQGFNVTLNRTASITWYVNGTQVQSNISVISADYTNSTAGIGIYNVTAAASDGYDSISRTWNWTVTPQAAYNVSGYVFDNYGSGLEGVLVQNGSKQNTTIASGYYLITSLINGTYNFSFSKPGFNTDYLEVAINGADNTSANKTIYDTTPAASVSNPAAVAGNFYINNTWINPIDADYSYAWFRYSNDTTITNVSKPSDYLNLTWQPHYTQNISAQTVDAYGNINQTKVWFNATIPNNAPFQYSIGDKVVNENENIQFSVAATDADNDTITYGTNATKGSFDTTTGNFSWTPGYADAGTYTWYFNSSDGYGGIAVENIAVTVNNTPLSIVSSLPLSDPTTEQSAAQSFNVTLNRTADVTWYINGVQVQINTSVISASYTNSTAGIGIYNVTASASDSYDSATKSWNWTVVSQSLYNVSGYVFDNYGSGLEGALVQNGSYQNITVASGYYSITGLFNGTYNFSYSKAGFNTDYLEVAINGADNISANKTIYDTTPPASVSNPATVAGNFYVNNTWANPVDADYNHAWFKDGNGTTITNVSKPTDYLNLTWQPHYVQNISAQTVDIYGNVNQTAVWFNTTIPNNVPVLSQIGNKTVDEGQWLNFTISAADLDNDSVVYGTNATKGSFNTTTGNFSWLTEYSDAGAYDWYFNSSDGYGGVATENIMITVNDAPLSITSFSPLSDPTTEKGAEQSFGISLNRTANITWYVDGAQVQTNESTSSANYTNSTADIGGHNVTAIANDNYDSTSKVWNWTVTSQSVYIVSGYVFDNYGSGLDGVLVQNGSSQNTTASSGYYLITGLMNGTYNFSFSKAGFNTGYLEVTINGADNMSANRTIYDTTPAASVSNPATITGNFYINNTWVNPADADFNYTQFRYSDGTDLQNISPTINYLNLTWQPHYTQNISAQTVDTYGNINQTKVWFNATIPNNAPFQYSIGDKAVNENGNLQINVVATDADSDQIIYGTNATKGNFNTTTGNFSWTPGYGDAGVYTWYFNSSDGYGGAASETITVTVNNMPLSITSSLPSGDPTSTIGTAQMFIVDLNRTADVNWYINGSIVQTNLSVLSATYTNSTAGIGVHTVTAAANDSFDSVSRAWNWTVIAQPTYNVSGYVFDNYGAGLEGVLVQSGGSQSSTITSGYYLITGLINGTYNFSFSKPGFDTGYLDVAISGADNTSANKTIYDTAPPAQVTGLMNDTPTQTTVNLTWDAAADANYYQVFRDSTSIGYTRNTYWNDTGLIADTLYGYEVRANDSYNNWGQNSSVLNVNTAPAADTSPPASISGAATATGNFYINNTWINPADADFNHIWFRYSNETTLQNVSKPVDYLNLTWQPHYTQNISAQTVDTSGNVNQTKIWFNATIPNNVPILSQIGNKFVDEEQWLNFTVSATDLDNDTITYGTNSTKGSLNTATGNFSWLTTYSDAGTYTLYFNSSDGYGGIAVENMAVTVNNTPLSITSSAPLSDPTTTQATEQSFSISLNRTADVTWYMNGTQVQTNTSTASAVYTNSTAGVGVWNVTASATDGIDTASRIWNWTVIAQPTYSLSGYVFDNYGSGLEGVLVQDGSKQVNTIASGYYTITGLLNGTYNFSYSKAGFDTDYLEVTISGADIVDANKTLYDTTPPAQVTGLMNNTPTQTTVNLSWDSLAGAYYYQVFRNSGSLGYTQDTYWNDTGLIADTLYEYTVRANDSYNNWGQNSSILSIRTAQAADTTPPASISAPATAAGNFYVNNTWTNPDDADYSHAWFRYSNGTTLTNVSKPVSYLNLTWQPHYTQSISAQTVDTSGNVNQTRIWFNTTIPNNAPFQYSIGDKAVNENENIQFNVVATDADSDQITYGTNATKGSFNATTGNFSWTPTYGDARVYTWYFNSSDGYGGVASETIVVTVNNVPLSIISSAPSSDPTTTQGTAQSFSMALNRTADVTWYMNGALVQTNVSTTSATYTNSTAGAGTWTVTASATDGIDITSKVWNWTINVPQPATYIPPDPVNLQSTTGNFWANHTWQAGAGSNATDSYNISVNGIWDNGTIDTFKNTTTTQHGWVDITVWAYNSSGTGSLSAGSISQSTQVPNNPPQQASIGNKAVDEGQSLSFAVSTTDADNDVITYGTNATKGSLNTTTGQFSWTPGYGDAGVYVWYFNSSDNYGGVASETITVTVNNVLMSVTNSLPASNPTTTVGTVQAFSITLNRTANITWYLDGSTIQINSSSASASYTNSTAGVGVYNVTAAATDDYDAVSKQWNWTVSPQPVYAPSITSWSNSKTNNNSLTLAVNTSETTNFNVTSNQTITTWNWYKDGVNQNNDYDNLTTSWDTSGIKSMQVNATNSNGTSNTITWTVTVLTQPATYNVSGYVFDNSGSGLGDVQVQNGSKKGTSAASGYYLITGLFNGTYNFSYSKTGFNTGYLEVTISGADFVNANKTINNTEPPASVSNINATPAPQYINWTWTDPSDSDFDHVEVYVDNIFTQDVTRGMQYYNASYFMPNSTHMISTRTVDTYGNMNTTWANYTAATSSAYTYVSGFQNTTGMVTDFSSARSASDDGASAIFAEEPTSYQLNITTNITGIPEATNRQELQLRYNVSGDNFTLQLWNGTTWNNRTTLNDTTLSYRNITLAPDELILQGASAGNAGSINNYYVLVRYLDLDAARQGRLYLDYQRVYSE